jgi:hypothetical protein
MNAGLSMDMDVIMANSNLAASPDPTNPVLQPTMRPSDVGMINSAWITGNQAHPTWMSELPLTPLSALPSPNAFTSLADLSIPSQSTGATPSQESTLISTEHLTMSSTNGPLALDGLSATWNPVADQGIADTPSDLVTGSDSASFSTLLLTGTPRTKPPSSISSRITDQPLNAGASAAVSQTRSTATSFSPREVPTVEGGLHALLYHDPTALRELVDIFFSEIHPYWPILHVPTFEIGIASDTLLGSMVMLASWIIGRNEHLDLAPLVFDAVMSATGPVCRLCLIELKPPWVLERMLLIAPPLPVNRAVSAQLASNAADLRLRRVPSGKLVRRREEFPTDKDRPRRVCSPKPSTSTPS